MHPAPLLKPSPRRLASLAPFAASVVAFCLVLLSAPAAKAEDKTAARDHWERGTKFYDLGKYDDAIKEFEAAYEAKGDPAFLYNLAQAHRLAGHPTEALRFYRTYLRYVPKAPNRSDIEDRIKELEKFVAEHPPGETTAPISPPPASGGALTAPPSVVSASPTPSAGTGTGAAGAATGAPGTPGTGTADQAGPSPPPFTGTGSGTGAGPEVSTTAAADAPPSSRRKTIAVVAAASGGGLIVVGAIFGLVARSQSKKVETAADNGDRFDPSVESLGKTAQTVQWIGYGVGVAAVVTGVVLYVTARPPTETQPPRVAVAPLPVPGAGGALSLSVRF